MKRRHVWVSVAAATGMLIAGVTVGTIANANVGTSLFEGNDGNTIVNTAGNKDWISAPGVNVVIQTDQDTGQCDNSFTQGSKEDETNVVIGLGSIPNSKADLGKFGVGSETLANGHVMMYLAWTRNNLSGTTNFDFEINQTAQPNMVIQCPGVDRAITLNRIGDAAANGGPGGALVDDILINYDIQGGAQNPTLGFRRWTGTAWSAPTALNSTNSEGRISSSPQVFDNVSYPAAAFGEAAIDMTAAGIIPNQNDPNAPCTAFGSAYVKSRASSSFTAQMKDYIAPAGIGLDTCGSITIDKVTLPSGDTQQFTFTPSSNLGGGAQFQLADATAPKVYGTLSPGTFSVAETVPSDWILTSATCSDGSPVTAISLQANEDITCTFTNTKKGRVIVDKVTDPNPDNTGTVFDFTGSFGPFTLTNAQAPFDSGLIAAGVYNVAESAEPGWTPTGSSCSDGSAVSAINVDPGETVTCTFNNEGRATIIVQKVTVPAGSTETFNFQSNFASPANFSLDGAANNSKTTSGLAAGTYSVSEDAKVGWDLTASSCSDGSAPGNIGLSPGETVTCTFENTQRGHIIVEKQTDPNGSTQSFEFVPSYGAHFFLTDGQQNDSGPLVPGNYSVSEILPPGWELDPSVVVCSDGDDPSAISLAPGQTITCIFTNEQDARIFVTKVTDPAGDTASFPFVTNYAPGGFSLQDGGINDSGALEPSTQFGPYSVAENTPAGWTLTDASCVSSNGGALEDPAAIDLQAGEIVNCTFSNRKDAGIVVEKIVDGRDPGESFTYTNNIGMGSTALSSGQSFASSSVGNLVPGTYNVTENGLANWLLLNAIGGGVTGQGGNVVCDDGSPSNTISLQAGETVTCTFHNEWQVGAVLVTKTAKSAADKAAGGDGIVPVSGVQFQIIADNGQTTLNMDLTDANGQTCMENFGFQDVTVHEIVPPGYAPVADVPVTIDNVAYCPGSADLPYVGAGDAEFVNIENVPLTDVTITVDSLIDGGTSSRIECYDKDGNLLDTLTAEDGSLYIPDIEPTDPAIATLDCKVFIDP